MTEFREPLDQQQWNDTLAQFPDANLLQSWQWGEVNATLGHTIGRQIIEQGGTVVGAFAFIVKSAKRGRYLEIPGGPLLDWSDSALVDDLFVQIRQLAVLTDVVFVRLRSQLIDTPNHRAIFADHDGVVSPMHVTADHTSIIALTSDEELLTAMRQQTRYEVKRANKRDVVVTEVETAQFIDGLHRLQQDTATRQGFIAPSLAFLKACVDSFGVQAHIYAAHKNNQLLNMALVLDSDQESAYFEAASTTEARGEPGAYAIVWQAMRDARVRGMTRFNLWGTAPPDSPRHRYAGVTTFKRGFGGEDVAYTPAYDFPIKRRRYRMTRLFEQARKKRRKL